MAQVVLLDNSMARVTLDAGARLVEVRLLRGDAPRADFDALKEAFVRLYEGLYRARPRTGRVSMRFDLSGCGWVAPAYVGEWARLFREHARVTDAVVERSVVVMANPLMRAAVGGFLALYPTRRPVDIVSA